MCGACLGHGIFGVNSRVNLVLLRCPNAFRPRRLAQNAQLIKWDLVQVLVRRSCGDPDKVLSKRFLHYLVQVLVRRSCGDLGEILSCNAPCGKILLQSSKRSLHDLVQVPVRRS